MLDRLSSSDQLQKKTGQLLFSLAADHHIEAVVKLAKKARLLFPYPVDKYKGAKTITKPLHRYLIENNPASYGL